MTCRVGAIVEKKTMWKPWELSIPRKIVNQKQHCTPGGIAEISATMWTWMKVVTSTTSSSTHFIYWLIQKTDGSRRQWIIVHITHWWLQSQLFYQMWLHCLSKLTHTPVPGTQLPLENALFLHTSFNIEQQKQVSFRWHGQKYNSTVLSSRYINSSAI